MKTDLEKIVGYLQKYPHKTAAQLLEYIHRTFYHTENTKKELFLNFWVAYPKKNSKQRATSSFLRQSKQDIHNLMNNLGKYIFYCDLMNRPYCDPATYINNRRWEDQELHKIPNKQEILDVYAAIEAVLLPYMVKDVKSTYREFMKSDILDIARLMIDNDKATPENMITVAEWMGQTWSETAYAKYISIKTLSNNDKFIKRLANARVYKQSLKY